METNMSDDKKSDDQRDIFEELLQEVDASEEEEVDGMRSILGNILKNSHVVCRGSDESEAEFKDRLRGILGTITSDTINGEEDEVPPRHRRYLVGGPLGAALKDISDTFDEEDALHSQALLSALCMLGSRTDQLETAIADLQNRITPKH